MRILHRYGIGYTFGHWTVLGHVSMSQYLLGCKCGKQKTAAESHIFHSKACGRCSARERVDPTWRIGLVIDGWTLTDYRKYAGKEQYLLVCETCGFRKWARLKNGELRVGCKCRYEENAVAEATYRHLCSCGTVTRTYATKSIKSEIPTLDGRTRFDDDAMCREIVRQHPDGMTLGEVGVLFGVCRERIRQIEERALEKLAKKYGATFLAELIGERSNVGNWDAWEDSAA